MTHCRIIFIVFKIEEGYENIVKTATFYFLN